MSAITIPVTKITQFDVLRAERQNQCRTAMISMIRHQNLSDGKSTIQCHLWL